MLAKRTVIEHEIFRVLNTVVHVIETHDNTFQKYSRAPQARRPQVQECVQQICANTDGQGTAFDCEQYGEELHPLNTYSDDVPPVLFETVLSIAKR